MERCCWSRKDDVPATQQQQRKSYDRSRVVGRESGGEQATHAAVPSSSELSDGDDGSRACS